MSVFALVLILGLITALPANANPACPICTIGVVAGLEVARESGLDIGVVGIWSGALLALLGYWTIVWFDKKKWNFKFRNPLLMILSLSMIAGVYVKNMEYTPKPFLLYLDPFLFCTICGALILIGSSILYQWMKDRNNGHAHFPFEKVVLPILALVIASVAVNYLQICQTEQNQVQTSEGLPFPEDGSDIYPVK